MCVSCGCGVANDDHGDPRNITQEDLEAAAEAAGLDVEDVLVNIEETAGDTLEDDFYEFAKDDG
jgi:hypothetical protein